MIVLFPLSDMVRRCDIFLREVVYVVMSFGLLSLLATMLLWWESE
jgi:hypothetical protein